MPFNGSGVYAPSGSDFPAVSGTLISSSKYNNVINDVASALSLVIVADGQRAASADLPMGGFKHTGVADGTARNNYSTLGQIQDGGGVWCGTAGGTANALTLSPTPAIAAYATGQRFFFKAGATTNSSTVTVAISGLGTKAIQLGGTALVASEILINQWYSILYDGAAFQLTLLSTAAIYLTPVVISGNVTLTAASADIIHTVTATATITLPAASALTYVQKLKIKSITTGEVLIDPAGTDTLDGLTTNYRLPSYCSMEISKSAAGAFVITQCPEVSVGDWKWGGYSTEVQGWKKAGQNLSRTTYASLFAVYSTTFGTGDGSTTFGLPFHQGRTAVGAGTGTETASGVNADVDTTGDTLTVATNTDKWVTGMPVVFTLASGTITGLSSGNTYYVVRSSTTLIKLASTLALAQAGTGIDLTAKSSPVWTITYTLSARTIGDQGGEEAHAMSSSEELAHTHAPGILTNFMTYNSGGATSANSGGTQTFSGSSATASTGGNAAMNIMTPYMVGELYIKT